MNNSEIIKTLALIGQKAILLNGEGKLLILQRSERSGQGGKWSLPGGALENREDPTEGVEREIFEETQLKVQDIRPFSLFSYTNERDEFVVIIGYTCLSKNQAVQLNWEHDAFKWVTKEEALRADLTEHAKLLITRFIEDAQ